MPNRPNLFGSALAIEAFRLMLVLEGKYHIVCISGHVCLPPDMRTADFSKPFIYHMVKVDIGKYREQYGTLRAADIITV
ncbi:hypothetical protein H922_14507 [Citrobacter freundii GTC 09629]|nr:hypothetical protein H922_14507 [Citrobacter freundii GTC 09629]KTL84541.1 hypothetical protein IN13_14410 [Salmonella enterica]